MHRTRSGRPYRVDEEMSEDETAGAGLAGMMQLLIEDRRKREQEVADDRLRREQELADERRKREEEFAAERALMKEQLEALRRLVERPESLRTASEVKDTLKLAKLGEEDDIEAYLTTFERMMAAYEVGKPRWTYKLAPQLSGKAQQAFAAMDRDKAGDYDEVKAAILRRYNINNETYRQRFRGATRKVGESHRELAIRLQDAAQKWTKDCHTIEELREAIVVEQLLNKLPEDIRVWVKERKPKTSAEAGGLADDYLQARKESAVQQKSGASKPNEREERRQGTPRRWCRYCESGAHWTSDCPKKTKNESQARPRPRNRDRNSIICFNCDKRGHIALNCPEKALYCKRAPKPPIFASNRRRSFYRHGTVDGKAVSNILLDTGCSNTLIRRDLVPESSLLDSTIDVQCAHGDCMEYPLTELDIEANGKHFEVLAGVSEGLPTAVLLGEDVSGLQELLEQENSATALVVTTRAAAKRQEKEAAEGREADDGDVSVLVSESNDGTTSESEDEDFGANFDDQLFLRSGKSRKSRGQRRTDRQQYNRENYKHALEISAEELQRLQEEDPSLSTIKKAAEGEANAAGVGFYKKDGLLYRKWTPPGRDEDEMAVQQLVLPVQCREAVLQLAHNVPLAGHMGKTKTSRRILQRFYWPSLFRDVAKYCRSCPECQKCSTRRVSRAPLIPLPAVEEPFRRIAMDIVGPLPRSRAGNQYILVICDYATRVPGSCPNALYRRPACS